MWHQRTAGYVTSPRYLVDMLIIFSCFHSLSWAKSYESSQLSHLQSFSGFHALLMAQLQFYAQLTVQFSPSLVLIRTACLFCFISPRKLWSLRLGNWEMPWILELMKSILYEFVSWGWLMLVLKKMRVPLLFCCWTLEGCCILWHELSVSLRCAVLVTQRTFIVSILDLGACSCNEGKILNYFLDF